MYLTKIKNKKSIQILTKNKFYVHLCMGADTLFAKIKNCKCQKNLILNFFNFNFFDFIKRILNDLN